MQDPPEQAQRRSGMEIVPEESHFHRREAVGRATAQTSDRRAAGVRQPERHPVPGLPARFLHPQDVGRADGGSALAIQSGDGDLLGQESGRVRGVDLLRQAVHHLRTSHQTPA